MQIAINGEIFKLIEYECSPVFIEVGDKTQTMDGTTHVEKRKIKRVISATTIDLLRKDAYRLLQLLRNTYLTITYQDPITNSKETRVFTLENNPSFKVKFWKGGREYYEGVQLEFIEKGAE